MSPRRFTEVSLLIATVLWPDVAMPAKNVVVVITPPPVRPQPDLQRPFSIQPPQQWAPPVARGSVPGPRLPAARCFTDGHDCPLEQTARVGEPCTCGSVSGRALIPPSREPISAR
jgi:hypothetical protein